MAMNVTSATSAAPQQAQQQSQAQQAAKADEAAKAQQAKQAEEAKRNEQPKPVVNAQGQTTGKVINITA